MDPAILSATSALVGSLVGGLSTLAASWLTQRGQLRAQTLVHEAVKRETLYAEFIVEASKRLADAWSHQAQGPDVIAGLYAAIHRMRLTSSDDVVRVADKVIRQVIEAYAAPDRTFAELRDRLESQDDSDLLNEFSRVCREDLRALR
jgi:hypothetical protein